MDKKLKNAAYWARNRAAINARRRADRVIDPTVTRAANLKRKFSLTVTEYETMFEAQGGRCAICRSTPDSKRLAVDHDHQTGQIRGLLCANCNRALGLMKDNVDRLAAAIEYLTRKG